jgi:signal transduction histidine kinase
VTRRISLAFLALITGLLVLAVVPLGVSMSNNENTSFRYAGRSAALQLSSDVEEYLSDHHADVSMRTAIASAAKEGDCAAVYNASGTMLATTPCGVAAAADARALVSSAFAGHSVTTSQDGRWLRVAAPVGDNGNLVGAVVYARSADSLNDRITVVWAWLVLIGVVGLALGGGLATWLARWVSRPLTALGSAAASLGDGTLQVRAPADRGPREVRRLAATFNLMAERTETLVHSHRGWVADVSHQLRTPLTALRLRLDLLADDVGEEEVAAELAGAQEEIARLSRLVDGLLALARAEGSVPRAEAVQVDAVAVERVAAWEPVARERRVGLSLIPVRANAYLGPGDLEQMLDNVLANALEAVPDGGGVRIEIAEADARVALRVVDNGPGMGPTAKEAAFRRFANPGAQGNGLGLAIVHRLAAGNGGTVRLLDSPGGGLTVELDLPAAQL